MTRRPPRMPRTFESIPARSQSVRAERTHRRLGRQSSAARIDYRLPRNAPIKPPARNAIRDRRGARPSVVPAPIDCRLISTIKRSTALHCSSFDATIKQSARNLLKYRFHKNRNSPNPSAQMVCRSISNPLNIQIQSSIDSHCSQKYRTPLYRHIGIRKRRNPRPMPTEPQRPPARPIKP
ncbi:hypothetical protein [Burkholderia savannae]|uniref:hypothetical protein n=1 Tax=Burkholderia savannae TaxID=1637837 RepID=UPI000AFF83C9|nr:hypothetical protein [Burkholderia savannae]